MVALAVWCIGIVLCILAMPASASADHEINRFIGGPPGSAPGSFGELGAQGGITVDEASGQIYAADFSNNRINRYDATGRYELCIGVSEPCSNGAESDEVGNFGKISGIAYGPETSSLYVLDSSWRVQQFTFDDNGTPADSEDDKPVFERAWGWGVQDGSPGFQICADGCQAGIPGAGVGQIGALGGPGGPGPGGGNVLAVGPADGDIYVSDRWNARVLRFNGDGTLDESPVIGSEADFATARPVSVAVDSQGIVYAADRDNNSEIDRFDAEGIYGPPGAMDPISVPPLANGGAPERATSGMIVEPDSDGAGPDMDRLFIIRDRITGNTVIQQINNPGQQMAPSGVDAEHAAAVLKDFGVMGLAINDSSDTLYTGAGTVPAHSGGVGIYAFSPVPASRDVEVEIKAPSVSGDDVTFSGTVDPLGGAAQYAFEYSRDGNDWTTVPGGGVVGSGPQPAAASTSDLGFSTQYRVRLVATKVLGPDDLVVERSGEQVFVTHAAPPSVEVRAARRTDGDSAEIVGVVNPNNLPTTYYFEYGKSESYGTQVPVPVGDVGAGGAPQVVGAELSGLERDTPYHYRLVAINGQGQTTSEDRVFRTRPEIPAAPPGRAYEMVTPPDKNNRMIGFHRDAFGIPIPLAGIPSISGDGMLVTVPHGILSGDAGTAFPVERDTVLIRRGTEGWTAEASMNVKAQQGAVVTRLQPGGVSGDLETQSWYHQVPIFPSLSRLGTRLFDDAGGYQGSGWYDWMLGSTSTAGAQATSDSALIDDAGERMLRWSTSTGGGRGILGPTAAEDPSNLQYAGSAVYLQEPPATGPKQLVNACTGSSESGDATMVPNRDPQGTFALPGGDPSALDDDTIGSRSCEAGSVPSLRGAKVGGNGPDATAMSADGHRIFFTSPDPLTRVPGTIAFGGDGRSACAGVTIDGQPVEHVDAKTECPPQVFIRQTNAAGEPTVRWVSRPEVSDQAIGLLDEAVFEGASRDGHAVYFRTASPLTADDPNGSCGAPCTTGTADGNSWDLFRLELAGDIETDPTGSGAELTRISGGPDGSADPNTNDLSSGSVGTSARFISADGTRAYFVTNAPIGSPTDSWNHSPAGSGATNAPAGTSGNDETRNLYLYDADEVGDARWQFIAKLPLPPGGVTTKDVDGCATRFSLAGQVREGLGSQFGGKAVGWNGKNCVRGTMDGRQIVFMTSAQLTADDDDDAVDVYVYEAEQNRLTRLSAPPAGTEPYPCEYDEDGVVARTCNGDLGFVGAHGTAENENHIGLDGFRFSNLDQAGAIYFESAIPLIPSDTNGSHYDVYRWKNGTLSLISPGQSADHAFYSGNSRDGANVFFYTSQRLSPWEIDAGDMDIYDARIGGGLPPPPVPPAPCAVLSGACEGPATPEPEPIDPGQVDPGDPGNVGSDREPRSCAAAQRTVERLAHKARKVRRRARRASGPRARHLRRRAKAASRNKRQARRELMRCERGRR